MDIMTGIAVIVFIVGVFVLSGLMIVRSDRSEDAPRRRSRNPSPPMWTTTTTYGPMCPSVKIEDGRRVKLCTREANHDGDHRYKVIDLHTQEPQDDVL